MSRHSKPPRWVVEEFKALTRNYIPKSEEDAEKVEETLLEFCRKYPDLKSLLEPNDDILQMLEEDVSDLFKNHGKRAER